MTAAHSDLMRKQRKFAVRVKSPRRRTVTRIDYSGTDKPITYPGRRRAMHWHTLTGARLLYWRAPGSRGVIVTQYTRTGDNLAATSFTARSL